MTLQAWIGIDGELPTADKPDPGPWSLASLALQIEPLLDKCDCYSNWSDLASSDAMGLGLLTEIIEHRGVNL